ncbi:hypothetical protein EXIGLDRAFT_729851 [Exidia glandulosa HHB12029]|uniref:Uncharacterized protein n=1 Tax=Exidia glandulosa HHB12029 TaxID=1314781 RepID=A0A165LDY0_EXIGL|nr:hypothetical protein EXIGLDRAFT_729851 [Exidia glandulosa HHB12029]
MLSRSLTVAALAAAVSAHIGPWGPGMYCRNGLSVEDNDPNTNTIVNPLYQKDMNGFWFHGECRNFPPPEGEFMELPAGGSVQLELAGNRGQTTLSFDGKYTSEWPDGGQHPEFEDGSWNNSCITTPNLHAKNHDDTAGTVLMISYNSDINNVTPDNLVVISVLANSPWKRVVEYDIPADLPGCDDCICGWSWVPNNCGIPNMYMTGFKCKVTNARPDAPAIAPPQTPQWCEDDESKCVKGAKKMIIWHQDPSINNVDTENQPPQKDGQARSPGYNMKMGFQPGAQNDIFVSSASQPSSTDVPPSTEVPPSSSEPSFPTETPAPTSSPTPDPSASCSAFRRSGHRKHQRRLLSFAGFHISVDSQDPSDDE